MKERKKRSMLCYNTKGGERGPVIRRQEWRKGEAENKNGVSSRLILLTCIKRLSAVCVSPSTKKKKKKKKGRKRKEKKERGE